MEIKIKYQKNTVTPTIQALFCRIHPLWNSTEGNTAVFPEMFPVSKTQRWNPKLCLSNYDGHIHARMTQLLFRAIEERKRSFRARGESMGLTTVCNTSSSKFSAAGEGLQQPPKIWGNSPLTSSLESSFIFPLLQGPNRMVTTPKRHKKRSAGPRKKKNSYNMHHLCTALP